MRVMDKPDGERKLHGTETPLIGGLAILVPTFAVSLLYCLAASKPTMLLAVGAAALVLVIGLLDDRAGLSAEWRAMGVAGVIAILLAIDPLFILHTLSFQFFGWSAALTFPNWLAVPFVVFMVLGFVNAVNMADGMNGQLLGSVMLWSTFIFHYLEADLSLPFIILICSSLVAFAFNLRGRLFAGSAGSYAASLFIGLGAIAAYRLSKGTMPAQVPVYWFWLPVMDCVRLMVSRALEGKSPFAADRKHFHHLLLNHMPSRYVLAVYLCLLAAPGIAAMLSLEAASITLIACIGGYLLFVVAELRQMKPECQEETGAFAWRTETPRPKQPG